LENKMKNKILISLILMCLAFNLYSQRNITQEEYQKIITTDTYFWGRSDFDLPLDAAKKQASEELINQISAEFEKSINANDLLKKANYVKFEVEGNRTRIIFYIPKDSLYVERIVETKTVVKKPKDNKTADVQSNEVIKETAVVEKLQEVEQKKVEEPSLPIVETKPVKIESSNEIINTLLQIFDFNSFCVQLNRYKRQGKLFDSQSGTLPDNKENCIMAIFRNDVLEALYDTGGISRKDFLTGKTVQKPEDDYKTKQGIKVIFIKLN